MREKETDLREWAGRFSELGRSGVIVIAGTAGDGIGVWGADGTWGGTSVPDGGELELELVNMWAPGKKARARKRKKKSSTAVGKSIVELLVVLAGENGVLRSYGGSMTRSNEDTRGLGSLSATSTFLMV